MICKLMSGRWIFTVSTAVVFAYCSVTGKLSNEQIISVIMLVIPFYFGKQRTEVTK